MRVYRPQNRNYSNFCKGLNSIPYRIVAFSEAYYKITENPVFPENVDSFPETIQNIIKGKVSWILQLRGFINNRNT